MTSGREILKTKAGTRTGEWRSMKEKNERRGGGRRGGRRDKQKRRGGGGKEKVRALDGSP